MLVRSCILFVACSLPNANAAQTVPAPVPAIWSSPPTYAVPPEPSTPADGSKNNDETTAPPADRLHRIAVLNFGPPSSWQGFVGDMVGTVVNAKAWRDIIPMLERDKVTDVIVRINSSGGVASEVRPFNLLFQEEYKPRFRTVGWVESASGPAAIAPYPLEEFYFMPDGNLGACTGHPFVDLDQIIRIMETASAAAKRDDKIARSLLLGAPLSCSIDGTTGEVTWFQDLSGSHVVNPVGKILTLTSDNAVKFKFARAVAATPDEVTKAMGYSKYEWAGREASKFIDENMRTNDDLEKHFVRYFNLYRNKLGAAESAPAYSTQRRSLVGIAKKHLEKMKKDWKINPNIGFTNRVDDAWLMEQDDRIKGLLK